LSGREVVILKYAIEVMWCSGIGWAMSFLVSTTTSQCTSYATAHSDSNQESEPIKNFFLLLSPLGGIVEDLFLFA